MRLPKQSELKLVVFSELTASYSHFLRVTEQLLWQVLLCIQTFHQLIRIAFNSEAERLLQLKLPIAIIYAVSILAFPWEPLFLFCIKPKDFVAYLTAVLITT